MNYSNDLYIDFAPIDHGDITGVARVALSLIHYANEFQDVFIIRNLEAFHRPNYIPEYFDVSIVSKDSLVFLKSFSATREHLKNLPTRRVLSNSLSSCKILYPLWRPSKQISKDEFLILYDFSTVRFSETHSPETVSRFSRNLEHAAQFSTKCICISGTTKRDAIRYSSIDPEDLEVIYCGLNPFLEINRTLAEDQNTRARNFCKCLNFLFVSTLEPRKRILETLRWWQQSSFNDGANHLTIVGGVAWWSPTQFLNELEKARNSLEPNCVTFAGYIPEDVLKDYIDRASVLIYPSKYEGFGLPVQDALLMGTPVLASANSALLEFESESIEFVNGENVEKWDVKLRKLLSGKETKSSSDLEAKYSWDGYLQYIVNSKVKNNLLS